ncbi:MAG: 2-hydroxyacid dehydrogenase [Shimia sp.]
MPDLLVIGDITDAMEARLAERFTLHRLGDADLDDIGPRITHVCTTGHHGIPQDVLAACPSLKMAASYGVGYDAIDTEACVERGILVTHTPDVLNAEVATTTLLLMLAAFRDLRKNEAWVRDGTWAREGAAPLSRSADGRRIGFLGMGRIGQEIARKLAPFDPEIAYHSRSPKDVPHRYEGDLVALATWAEVLIVIVPGGPATRNLVDRAVLEALGPDGTLINVARGSVVDEPALVAALEEGRLGYAALDVFEDEPHVPAALTRMKNVVLTPHIGSATHQTRAAMGALVVDNLIAHLDGAPIPTPIPETKHLA